MTHRKAPTRGSWTNDDVDQCGGILQPFLKSAAGDLRTKEYRCLLDEGHKGDHRGEGFITWKRQALMGHREDPTRGVFTGPCERCGQVCPCRLRMVDNGYRWVCVDGCEVAA